MRRTNVLICGGGPVGLTASILLSDLGIANVVVEKRPDTSQFPRARGMNCRTVEIWRAACLVEQFEAISLSPEWTDHIVYLTTLAGPEIGRMPSESMSREATARFSPAPFLASSQNRIDAVLRAAAEQRPQADVRFRHELTSFTDDGDSVTAVIAGPDGQYELDADWLIAADGANSPVRAQAGIELQGLRTHRWYLSSHFTADLSRFTAGRRGALLWTLEPGLEGVFQPLDGDRDWSCGVLFDADVEPPQGFTAHRVIELIRRMIGAPGADVDIELLSFRPWYVAATVASRLRAGRVVLAGDAAHQIPPYGGIGMNTGVQDAHALAWRLAALVLGWGADGLLDSYDVERREVAARVCEFAKANMRHIAGIRALRSVDRVRASREYGNWNGLDLGVHYERGALIPDGTPRPPVANEVTEYRPSARPGERAPHHWLRDRDGIRLSTLDLFGHDFVLLTAGRGDAWRAAALEVAGRRAVPLRTVDIAPGGALAADDGEFASAYGIAEDGAVLVRPDGHVAFRARNADGDPFGALHHVFDVVLGNHTVSLPASGAAR
jgi:2-polyprenyl-6-methoxyphenol hydroxylase-like FAD-dependent oxidoreductase